MKEYCRIASFCNAEKFHFCQVSDSRFSWHINKISGKGEILDWSWVNDPKVYGHCRIKDVIIGKGIKKLGYVDYSRYRLENITILDPECIICETSDNADPTGSDRISNV